VRAIGLVLVATCMLVSAAAGQTGRESLTLNPITGEPMVGADVPEILSTSALSGAVDPALYVVGPGDLFQLNLSGRITRSITLQVGPEGTLFLPGAGSLPVAGLTLEQARRAVIHGLAGQFRGVTVDFRLARVRLMQVYLTGEVRNPGPVAVPGYCRASDVLIDSLLTQRASRRNISIARRNASGASGSMTTLTADLERFRRTGDVTGNPLLRDGDILNVPAVGSRISIDGAVSHPLLMDYAPGDSLRTLLAMAGGPLPAAAGQGLLVRFRDATTIDSVSFEVANVLAGEYNPALRDGDRAYVYFQPRFHQMEQATIFGEVRRPGSYPLATGRTRLTDLVTLAGGFMDRADLSTIRVFRASGFGQETDPELERLAKLSRREMTSSEYEVLRARQSARREDYRVDWHRVLESRDLDIVLHDGDIVRVDPVIAAVRVDGEVRRPGVVQFVERRSVDEYIRLAGGYSDRAARGQVRVTRAVTGQTILARDVTSIAPGDLVWVPERGEVPVWQTVQSVILVLAQIATVILAIKR